MRTYQALTLIGGIFGIVVTPIVLISLALGMAIFSSFDSDSSLDPESLGGMTAYSLVITISLSIIAIIMVFATKKTKTFGYVLLGFAAIMLVATNFSGIVTWVLFFAGGISAIKYKEISNVDSNKGSSSLDILKERYAKGEISQEEFDIKKKDLD